MTDKTPDEIIPEDAPSPEESLAARAAELDEREAAFEASFREREEALDARMADFMARIESGEAVSRAPRERGQDVRSRVLDDTRRLERPALDEYSPPSVLEVPKSPDYDYRWVAEWVNGSQTPRNVQMRIREGYQRVPISALPEDFMVDEDDKGDGWARTSGLILMRVDKAQNAKRRQFYERRSRSRLNAANELQGLAGKDAVQEDRGTRALTGAEAGAALQRMSQS